MQQILLTLGDSWPEGAELNFGDKRYGELIQDVLGYDKFYNYGSAGASNEDMMYQLQRYIAESHEPGNRVTAVFFLTNPARSAHWPRFSTWT